MRIVFYMHERTKLNSPFNKTPDYNKLEQGLLNMDIVEKQEQKLSVKNKLKKSKYFFSILPIPKQALMYILTKTQ